MRLAGGAIGDELGSLTEGAWSDSAPRWRSTISRRSCGISARRAKGTPKPQTRFWMASANAKVSRPQPRVPVIGSSSSPYAERAPKPSSAMRQPAAITISGVRQLARGLVELTPELSISHGILSSKCVTGPRLCSFRCLILFRLGQKRAACAALGADEVLDYGTEGDDSLKKRIRAVSRGGVDVVVDPVGGAYSEPALRALRAGGRLLVIGFAAGDIPRVPLNLVLLRNRAVVGVEWASWMMSHRDGQRRLVGDLLALLEDGRLHPSEPVTYPLADVERALADIAGRACVAVVAWRLIRLELATDTRCAAVIRAEVSVIAWETIRPSLTRTVLAGVAQGARIVVATSVRIGCIDAAGD